MKCEAIDCHSNHGYVCYDYYVPEQSVYWFCHRSCRALWRFAHGLATDGDECFLRGNAA